MSSRLPESPSGATTPGSPGEVLTCVNPDEWEGQPITAANVGFTAGTAFWGDPVPTTVASALNFLSTPVTGSAVGGSIGTTVSLDYFYTPTKSGRMLVIATICGTIGAVAAAAITATLLSEGANLCFQRTSAPANGAWGMTLAAITNAPLYISNNFQVNATAAVTLTSGAADIQISVHEI